MCPFARQVIREQTKFLLKWGLHKDGKAPAFLKRLLGSIDLNLSDGAKTMGGAETLYAVVPADWEPDDQPEQWQGMLNDIKKNVSEANSQNRDAIGRLSKSSNAMDAKMAKSSELNALDAKVAKGSDLNALEVKMESRMDQMDSKLEDMHAILTLLASKQ